MTARLLLLAAAGWPAAATAADPPLPVHPDDLAVLRRIAGREKLDAPPEAAAQGWPLQRGEKGVRFASKENPRHALTVVLDAGGRVVKYLGNGPILSNESCGDAARLPELRVVRIDHNGSLDKSVTDRYDGSGFAALADSKLAEIHIGLSFSDKGMEQAAKITTLRSFAVGHSRVTDAGVAFFEGHPNLEAFSIAEMASGRVTGKSLASIAKMPKVARVGFKEAVVTYDGGLAHLAPLKGRLTDLDLSMGLVRDADLAKLTADHPGLKVTVTPPADIAKRHIGVARTLVRNAPADLAAPLKAAVDAAPQK